MGKQFLALLLGTSLTGCSIGASGISLTEADLQMRAQQSGDQTLPPLAAKIFANAESVSGTCALKDAKWIEEIKFADASKSGFKRSFMFKRGIGTVEAQYVGDTLTYFGGTLKDRWMMQDDIVVYYKLSRNDLINHLVDNWFAYCPPYRSIWREVSISEESLNNKPVYKVSLIEPYYQSPISFWFDKKTKLMIAREYVNEGKKGQIIIRDAFSNFRNVGGYRVPVKMHQYKDSKKWATVKYAKFLVDQGIPDSSFKATD